MKAVDDRNASTGQDQMVSLAPLCMHAFRLYHLVSARLKIWELTFRATENENFRVGSKPSAHVKPVETLSLSRASLPPF